jgi:hydrogenase-4 component B
VRGAAAVDPPRSMLAALGVLAAGCVALGVAPGLVFASLAGLAPWPASAPTAAGLRLPGTGSLPTPGIAVVLIVLTAALALARGRRSAAPAPSWACGQLVEPQLRWTSAGFTKPLRLVLEALLRPGREIAVVRAGGVVQAISYRGHVPHLIEDRLYRPAARLSLGVAVHARRVQSGRLGVYIAYLIALVLVLLLAARIGVIG